MITFRCALGSRIIFLTNCQNNFQTNYGSDQLYSQQKHRPSRPEARKLFVFDQILFEFKIDRFWSCLPMVRGYEKLTEKKGIKKIGRYSKLSNNVSPTTYHLKWPSSIMTNVATFGQLVSSYTCW